MITPNLDKMQKVFNAGGLLYVETNTSLKKWHTLDVIEETQVKKTEVSKISVSDYGVCCYRYDEMVIYDNNAMNVIAKLVWPLKKACMFTFWHGLLLGNDYDGDFMVERIQGNEVIDIRELAEQTRLYLTAYGENLILLLKEGTKKAFLWNRLTQKWTHLEMNVDFTGGTFTIDDSIYFISVFGSIQVLNLAEAKIGFFYLTEYRNWNSAGVNSVTSIIKFKGYIVSCHITGEPGINETTVLFHKKSGGVVRKFQAPGNYPKMITFMGGLIILPSHGALFTLGRVVVDFEKWTKATHLGFNKHIRDCVKTVHLLIQRNALPSCVFAPQLIEDLINKYLY